MLGAWRDRTATAVAATAASPAVVATAVDAGPGAALLDIARLDRSGRVYARPLLDALGWRAGHRVDLAVVAGVLVAASAPRGLHVVGSRGVLTLPAAARSMCGIEPGVPVVLLASLPQNELAVHPAATVIRLLDQRRR